MPFEFPAQLKVFFIRMLFLASVLFVLPYSESSANSGKAPLSGAAEVFEYKEPGLEFSIKIPPKWIAEPGSQRFAVSLKPSAKAERIKLPGGLVADPSITVAAVKKAVTFDSDTMDRIAAEIEENFTRYNGRDTGFKIFQKNILNNLPGEKSAFLYYVSFKTDGAEAGQAILITGNDAARYRVTLSDHRLNFDRNLELYYPFMLSITFPGRQETTSSHTGALPAGDLARWAVLVLIAGSLIGLLSRLRRNRAVSAVQYSDSTTSNAPASANPTEVSHVSQSPQWNSNAGGGSIQMPTSAGVPMATTDDGGGQNKEVHEHSMIPLSMIGVSPQSGEGPAASEFDAAFSAKDLSAPPQSIPLSQVVDESSAPPDMRKRWQISNNKKN